ncbi:MAG: UDP-N-acetylglucosamine 2-epimerase [Desulfobacterales bacterium]|nr:UDP-N-acetylglucosamine 2-epimerase [Desulfobacterales bacterium]
MNKICIITDSLKNNGYLTPLITMLKADEAVSLTVLSTDRYKSDDIELNFTCVEDQGPAADESLEIFVNPGGAHKREKSADEEQRAYAAAFNAIDPEIVVLFGNSISTFSAAVAAFLNNIPVAHIQGGESDYGVPDDAYGFGITKIANLHFTATETYRKRATEFGEHPDRVFNVGALAAYNLLSREIPDKEAFCMSMGMDPADEFIFISMVPDRSIGSRNAALMQSLTDALANPKYDAFKLVVENPGESGFGQIMKRQLDRLVAQYPGRVIFIKDEDQIPAAMTHCRAVAGNSDRCVVDAATLRTPVVSVGQRLKDRENPGHMIPAAMVADFISHALDKALCPSFKIKLMFMDSPFEQPGTPDAIKAVLQAYTPADIAAKTQYNG